MKKTILTFLVLSSLALSCKKEKGSTAVVASSYMSETPNSTWNYQVTDNNTATNSNYTLTSTNRDTTINSKTYHVFTNSKGTNDYYSITGNNYYIFQVLPLSISATAVENIYLKDNLKVNDTWNQVFNITLSGFPLVVTVTNIISETGISKTVNSISYSNVIHVSTSLTVSILGAVLPSSAVSVQVDNYYTKSVGMIQSLIKTNVDYDGYVEHTDEITNLQVAIIK